MNNSIHAQLEAEYCPPIDSTLLAAILLDYDLTSEHALREARATLDHLNSHAILEENTEFDPSGSAGFSALAVKEHVTGAIGKAQSTERSRSGETDLTSVSRSELSTDQGESEKEDTNDAEREYAARLEAMDLHTKEALLQEIFPMAKPFSITITLKKCRGNFKRTVDELLSLAFLDDELADNEAIARPKSVDAFAADNPRTKKKASQGRRGRRKQTSPVESIPPSTAPNSMPGTNAWRVMEEDIEFIASRTKVTIREVASVYHENAASIPATIITILDTAGNRLQLTPEEPVIQENAATLARDFPTISLMHVYGLIRLTHPSTAAAHELAKELVFRPSNIASTSGIQIVPQFLPIDTSTLQIDRPRPSMEYEARLDAETARRLASENFSKSNEAFDQASAAYRRGKSDPLFGGAAGYYSSLGRDYRATARAHTAEAADALVDSQSSTNVLDLHHVYVKDAVRIARGKVRIWWAGLGERQIGQRAATYKIVTGKGNHSEGGSGKIGPAVARMLMREKYKFEVGGGSIIVTGVSR